MSEADVAPSLSVEFHAALLDRTHAGEDQLKPEWLDDMRFASYQYSLAQPTDFLDLSTPTTPEGVRPGITVPELRSALPKHDLLLRGGDDYVGSHPDWFADPYGGRLSGDATDPDSIVLSVTAGRTLHAQPC